MISLMKTEVRLKIQRFLFLPFHSYDPVLTYGEPKPRAPPPLVPAFVALEKKVCNAQNKIKIVFRIPITFFQNPKQTLKFDGYYREAVNDNAEENFRVRRVEIFYYLEDDTIMVNEPKIEVSFSLDMQKRHSSSLISEIGIVTS